MTAGPGGQFAIVETDDTDQPVRVIAPFDSARQADDHAEEHITVPFAVVPLDLVFATPARTTSASS